MKRMKWMKKIVYLLAFSIFSSVVFGAPDTENFVNVFSYFGEFLEAFFNNEYAVFGIIVIAFLRQNSSNSLSCSN